jgi:ribonuclease P protein component
MRFLPEQHLRRQGDFDHVRASGRRYDAGAFTVFFAPRRPWPPAAKPDLASGAAPRLPPLVSDSGPGSPLPAPCSPLPEPARAGFVASRSAVGNAVARARAKRRLREEFRAHQTAFPPGLDFIFVARRSLNGLEHAVLRERFSTLCRKLFPSRAA